MSKLNLKVKGAFIHASSCANADIMNLVIKLIQKDANAHHVFFNDQQFHNHLVHQLLADYSLGADELRLRKAYDDNAIYQKAKKPLKKDFVWDSLNCLGNEDYYSNYVDFFQQELQNYGVKRGLEIYIFEQDPKLGFYARFLSGVYHPLIHLGYGIEFNYPLMIAEGLAWVAVHKSRSQRFYDSIKNNVNHSVESSSSPLEIVRAVHKDSRIDGVVSNEDEDKYPKIIHKISNILQEYCQQ